MRKFRRHKAARIIGFVGLLLGSYAYGDGELGIPAQLKSYDPQGNIVELQWTTRSRWKWAKSKLVGHEEPLLEVSADLPLGLEVKSTPEGDLSPIDVIPPNALFLHTIRIAMQSALFTGSIDVKSGPKEFVKQGLTVQLNPQSPKIMEMDTCRTSGFNLEPVEGHAKSLFVGLSCVNRARGEVEVAIFYSEDSKWAGSQGEEPETGEGWSLFRLGYLSGQHSSVISRFRINEQLGEGYFVYDLHYTPPHQSSHNTSNNKVYPVRPHEDQTASSAWRLGPTLGGLSLTSGNSFLLGGQLQWIPRFRLGWMSFEVGGYTTFLSFSSDASKLLTSGYYGVDSRALFDLSFLTSSALRPNMSLGFRLYGLRQYQSSEQYGWALSPEWRMSAAVPVGGFALLEGFFGISPFGLSLSGERGNVLGLAAGIQVSNLMRFGGSTVSPKLEFESFSFPIQSNGSNCCEAQILSLSMLISL